MPQVHFEISRDNCQPCLDPYPISVSETIADPESGPRSIAVNRTHTAARRTPSGLKRPVRPRPASLGCPPPRQSRQPKGPAAVQPPDHRTTTSRTQPTIPPGPLPRRLQRSTCHTSFLWASSPTGICHAATQTPIRVRVIRKSRKQQARVKPPFAPLRPESPDIAFGSSRRAPVSAAPRLIAPFSAFTSFLPFSARRIERRLEVSRVSSTPLSRLDGPHRVTRTLEASGSSHRLRPGLRRSHT